MLLMRAPKDFLCSIKIIIADGDGAEDVLQIN